MNAGIQYYFMLELEAFDVLGSYMNPGSGTQTSVLCG